MWQNLDVLQAIDSAISPLSTLTDILSGEKYVTISAVLPMLKQTYLKRKTHIHLLQRISKNVLLKISQTDTLNQC